MYQKTIEKHQDLNCTGKELSLLGKSSKARTSSNAQKKKRMTETQPFEFETQKRAKFNDDLLKNDGIDEDGENPPAADQKG